MSTPSSVYGYDEAENKWYYNPIKTRTTFYQVYDDLMEKEPPTMDENLALAGLLSSEIQRFKEKLLNQHLENMDNDIVVPIVPTTSPLLQQMKSSNDMQRGREEREILLAKANAEYMKTDIQIKLKDLELKEKAVIQNDAVIAIMKETSLQNERLLALTNRLNTNLGELRGSLAKIATASESQETLNQELLIKAKEENLKDIEFDGKTYSKTELVKIKDLETLKNVKDENDTLLNDGLELVEEFMTDGFDLDYNPLSFILGELKKEFNEDSTEIKTKYNLK